METDVITIDGPTSSGKNSVGFLLAQKLGYQYIDSGSIYRAGCIFILRNNIPLDDKQKIVNVFNNLKIDIKNDNGKFRVFVNGEDVTDFLHDGEVTKVVSDVSAIRQVREATRPIQRRFAQVKNTVMTGRDIGSEIFPEAKHKFYLTAETQVRAKRRFDQLSQKDPNIKYEIVLEEMEARDKKDSEREVSPLRIPKDAIVIDNSYLTVEETVEQMLKHIKRNVIPRSP